MLFFVKYLLAFDLFLVFLCIYGLEYRGDNGFNTYNENSSCETFLNVIEVHDCRLECLNEISGFKNAHTTHPLVCDCDPTAHFRLHSG